MARTTAQAQKSAKKSPAAIAADKNPIESAKATVKSVNETLLDALNNGTLACVAGPDGMADTAAPSNAFNGRSYDHLNALLLKSFAKEHGFEEKFLTISQLNNQSSLHANDGPQVLIKKGEHGQVVTWARPILDKQGNMKTNDKGEPMFGQRHEVLFSVSQTTDPERVAEWSKEEKQLRYEEGKARAAVKGRVWHDAKPESEKKAPETITASSSDPAVYLGEYYRAMDKGKLFQAPKEIASEFVEKFKVVLGPDHAPGQGLGPVNAAAVRHTNEIGQMLSEAYKQEHKQDFQQKAAEKAVARREKRMERLTKLKETARAKMAKRESYGMSM